MDNTGCKQEGGGGHRELLRPKEQPERRGMVLGVVLFVRVRHGPCASEHRF